MYATLAMTHKTRSDRRCDWCYTKIVTGDLYKRYRFYDGGNAYTVQMHPECYEAMGDAAKEEGGWIEWTPGDFERPKVEVKP